VDFLKGGTKEVDGSCAKSEVSVEWEIGTMEGRGKSSEGEEDSRGKERGELGAWIGKSKVVIGISELETGKSEVGNDRGISEGRGESKLWDESGKICWDAIDKGSVEVVKKGKRWGKKIVEWGEEE